MRERSEHQHGTCRRGGITSTGLFAGLWLAEDSGGERFEIDVYDHPELGLCVWYDDYAHGAHFCGNGHIPVGASDLRFLYPAND